MPRQFIRKYLPTQQSIRENRYLQRFGTALHHPGLWHLHRRSVAGGVAIGMFCGLIPGPFQMLAAALCAILFRVNLPVAAIVTWYTNPFTILPIYFVAYKLGVFVTGGHESNPPRFDFDFFDQPVTQWIPAIIDWCAAMGKPFVAGLVLLGAILAVAGYLFVLAGWRAHVMLAWRRRRRERDSLPSA